VDHRVYDGLRDLAQEARVRNPFRTEAEAFGFVLVCVGLFALVALAGILAGGWVAFGVFLVLALGLAVYIKGEPKEPQPAVWAHRPHERRSILVVANETVAGRALRGEVVRRAADDADVLVVCPALNSPLRHWASDDDAARAQAHDRLEESLSELAAAGVEARGEVGDADPIQAIEDALRAFDADEIVISTHPPGRSNWLEREVIERARERYPLPLTHVVVDLEQERRLPPDAATA
jgi:Universal stress protein family